MGLQIFYMKSFTVKLLQTRHLVLTLNRERELAVSIVKHTVRYAVILHLRKKEIKETANPVFKVFIVFSLN